MTMPDAKPRKVTMTVTFIKLISNTFWEIADYFSYQSKTAAKMYDNRIGDEYQKEYESCGVASARKILHIGSGAYPLTEMALAAVSNGQVVGIDKKLATVQKGSKIVAQRGMQDRINIRHGDGRTYPVAEFDTIIVSSCSLPKIPILEHLAVMARPKTNIIVREVDIAGPFIEDFLAAHPEVQVSARIRHNPFPFVHPIGWTTYRLQKQ